MFVSSQLKTHDPNRSLHRALAEFRRRLRRFLLISENAANDAGLHPQQHQLLLAVVGVPDNLTPSIAYAAESLGLKHNTVVELVDRCENEGLLKRVPDREDRRRVCLRTTARGQKMLNRLSQFHLQELNLLGPQLIQTLETILQNQGKARPRSSRKTTVSESHG